MTEYVSSPSIPETVWSSLWYGVVERLAALKVTRVEVMFGVSDCLHPAMTDLLFVPRIMPFHAVPQWLEEWQNRGFYFGRDDLYIFVEQPHKLTVKFCHEGDFHLETNQAEVLSMFSSLFADLGLFLLQRTNTYGR